MKVSYRKDDENQIDVFFLASSCVNKNSLRRSYSSLRVYYFFIVQVRLVWPDDRYPIQLITGYGLLENQLLGNGAPANASALLDATAVSLRLGQSRALFAVSVKISCPTLAQSSARTGGTSRQRWRDVPTQQTESKEQLRPH